MFWSIVAFLIALIVVGVICIIVFELVRFLALCAARAVKLEREGVIVKAWIVYANKNLYEKNRQGDSWNGIFVCSLQNIPRLDDHLDAWAEAIRDFEPEDRSILEEDAIAEVLRTEIGYPHPVRIPKRITGRYTAYFISFRVHCSLLPERQLTKPYVYCKFYMGENHFDGEAKMVAYPNEEDEEGR